LNCMGSLLRKGLKKLLAHFNKLVLHHSI